MRVKALLARVVEFLFTKLYNVSHFAGIPAVPQTVEGTQAWDTFMSLVATTRQLGISFFEYIRDRISQVGNIPSLATIIREKSALNSFGLSWVPE